MEGLTCFLVHDATHYWLSRRVRTVVPMSSILLTWALIPSLLCLAANLMFELSRDTEDDEVVSVLREAVSSSFIPFP